MPLKGEGVNKRITLPLPTGDGRDSGSGGSRSQEAINHRIATKSAAVGKRVEFNSPPNPARQDAWWNHDDDNKDEALFDDAVLAERQGKLLKTCFPGVFLDGVQVLHTSTSCRYT